MKKLFFVFFLVAGLILPLALFASGSQESDGAEMENETVTLEFWSWRPEDADGYAKIFKVFEEKNPGIKVEFKPVKNTEYNTVLATALEGGQGPDIMQLRAYGGLQRYTPFLMPLSDKIESLSDFSDSSIASASGRDDGIMYGVPFANQLLGVYYNKRIFKENNLSVPQNWDEFMNVLKTLKDNGITPLGNGGQDAWMLEILFGTIGSNFYGGSDFYKEVVAGKTNFKDPRFVEALEAVKSLEPYMPRGFMGMNYPSMQANFYTEQAAMYVGGSFEAAGFQTQNPDMEIGVFAAPTPAGSSQSLGTWADGSFGINAKTDYPEEALKLAKFMASQEFGTMFSGYLGQISAVPGVAVDPATSPLLGEFSSLMIEHGTNPYIMLVGFRWEQPTGSVALQNALQGMMQGSMTAEEVAEDVQSQVASWYKPFQ